MGILRARTVFLALFFFGAQIFSGAQLSAQSASKRPVASASTFEGGVGYLFMSQTSASQPRINLNGFDANGLVRLTARWGEQSIIPTRTQGTSRGPATASA